MKLLLVALNSQYIHTNLAVRYLKASVKDMADTYILELTVNDNFDNILRSIYEINPDVIGFSCYIWNIRLIKDIVRNIKKILKQAKIILGGPEVSFDPETYINQGADFVVSGEGEMVLRKLIDAMEKNLSFDNIPSITYILDEKVITNPTGGYLDPSVIPFPYDEEDIKAINGKIIYYETSRGCPYGCSYCLSSLDKKTRFWNTKRIKREVTWLYKHGVKFIKLVDRTFNCNKRRAEELFNIFSEYDGMRFHMEMVPDLIDKPTLEVLKKLNPDMFQFEIGVQSLNDDTLNEINRKNDFSHLKWVMGLLNEIGIKTHLDLIAGLPYEDYSSIINGFNRVYNLKPYEIQLGFLKMLKGTNIKIAAEKYGIKYLDIPPYEILCNDSIGYEHLSSLKEVSLLIDRYYNSHCFEYSLVYLLDIFKSPYEVFFTIYRYLKDRDFFESQHSRDELYCKLLQFSSEIIPDKYEIFAEILRFDFLLNNGKRTLKCFGSKNNYSGIKGERDSFYSTFDINMYNMEKVRTTYLFYKSDGKRYYKKLKEGEYGG